MKIYYIMGVVFESKGTYVPSQVNQMSLVSIRGLKTYFYTYEGVVKALDGVDLDIYKGETLGLVGETGCGKSVTALSIMRLIPDPPGKIVTGEIQFNGENLLGKSDQEMRRIRGNRIAMIFQEPMTSLNPVLTVGDQIAEAIELHQGLSKKGALKKATSILGRVGMPDPEKVVRQYPHELSGGMRQRCMIAMALSCNPDLLIADEPTTALDVTIQAQVLDLMRRLKEEFGSSILFITHDLGVIADMCDRVAVMYAGHVVECADAVTIFRHGAHPYTRGLMNAIPRMVGGQKRLQIIPGMVPNLIHPPSGCRFHPRCAMAKEICGKERPPMVEVEKGHWLSCWEKGEMPTR